MSYESPRFKVILKNQSFELRQYEEFYTSSVQEEKLGGDSGFSVLFSYISGNNVQRQPMEMTVPVINEIESNSMTMEFVIPKQFYVSGIPLPTRPNVNIRHYPSQQMAVYRFSGTINSKKLNQLVQQLKDWIQLQSMTIVSPLRIARYDSPYTLPFFRHNEILFTVEPFNK
jgi:effector-binding domain-containing protein